MIKNANKNCNIHAIKVNTHPAAVWQALTHYSQTCLRIDRFHVQWYQVIKTLLTHSDSLNTHFVSVSSYSDVTNVDDLRINLRPVFASKNAMGDAGKNQFPITYWHDWPHSLVHTSCNVTHHFGLKFCSVVGSGKT